MNSSINENIILRNKLTTSLIDLYNLNVVPLLAQFVEGEHAVLFILYNDNYKITPSMLSKRLNLTKGRVTAILSSLKRRKYIKMKAAKNDRRMSYVTITSEGKLHIEEKMKLAATCFDILIEKLGIQQTIELNNIIDAIVTAMKDVII